MPSPSNNERQQSYRVEISAGLARRLRETRLERGLSTAALAKAAGVGRTLILTAENPATGGGAMSRRWNSPRSELPLLIYLP